MCRPRDETPRLRPSGLAEAVMHVILRAGDDGTYAVHIKEGLESLLKRPISLGSIYPTLDRLEAKGFIASWHSDPTPTRGGRRKQMFRITAAGQQALSEAEDDRQHFVAAFPKRTPGRPAAKQAAEGAGEKE